MANSYLGYLKLISSYLSSVAISSKWEETLLACISILPPEVLKHQVSLADYIHLYTYNMSHVFYVDRKSKSH